MELLQVHQIMNKHPPKPQDSIGHHSSSVPYYSQDSFQEQSTKKALVQMFPTTTGSSHEIGFSTPLSGDSPSEHITIPPSAQRRPSMDGRPILFVPKFIYITETKSRLLIIQSADEFIPRANETHTYAEAESQKDYDGCIEQGIELVSKRRFSMCCPLVERSSIVDIVPEAKPIRPKISSK
ncbi:hypothetical protein SDJN02_13959, partial [Cucurbita argyrosperma subsp. argyrosperma]